MVTSDIIHHSRDYGQVTGENKTTKHGRQSSWCQGCANGIGKYGVAAPLYVRVLKNLGGFSSWENSVKILHCFVTLITVCDSRSSNHDQKR